MNIRIQHSDELNAFYEDADPWGYRQHPDDERRRLELLSVLPRRDYGRTLDIGCGNGFITFSLPGVEVVGIDISGKAIDWARSSAQGEAQPERFRFECRSLFESETRALGRFDLIVITGVLYEQYIGRGVSVVRCLIDDLLVDGGALVSCHIREWCSSRFPYTLLDTALYPYRDYTHQLEVFRK